MDEEVLSVLTGIERALERIASAIEKSVPQPPKCELCGSSLETFTAKDGTKYQRCRKGQSLYKAGTPEEGHYFAKA